MKNSAVALLVDVYDSIVCSKGQAAKAIGAGIYVPSFYCEVRGGYGLYAQISFDNRPTFCSAVARLSLYAPDEPGVSAHDEDGRIYCEFLACDIEARNECLPYSTITFFPLPEACNMDQVRIHEAACLIRFVKTLFV